MRSGLFPKLFVVSWLIATVSATAAAQNLAIRITPIPQTTAGVPHVQIGVRPVPELSQALLARVADLPGVRLGATRLSLPGFFLPLIVCC